MKKLITLFFICISTIAYLQKNLDSLSEKYITDNEAKAFILGPDFGEKFHNHNTILGKFNILRLFTPGNVKIIPYGKTNEGRDLEIVVISSAYNIKHLDSLVHIHQNSIEKENKAIVWLSFNVHGNEASCSEAAINTAYELLKQKEVLENTIVIIDPCLNPDGRDRYVNWYNQYRNTPPNTSLISLEHHEPWPSGRPNHYLFDLNRDWAWATQVETKQRLIQFNKFQPHVHVDFHEQWINNPYYFAPAAEPFHEVITHWQREFQTNLGKRNAKNFDEKGWLYFTGEEFDLLYPSYGDTYPTFCGAIGMTYEQAGHGKAGLAVETNNNDTLKLSDRIAHHTSTALETIKYSSLNAKKLIEEYKKFIKRDDYKYKSYIVFGKKQKLLRLKELLDLHEIKFSYAIKGEKVKGFNYENLKSLKYTANGSELIINSNQKKGNLIQVLFEPKTFLSDSLTYDITSWNLPYAYGLNAIACESLTKGVELKKASLPSKEIDKQNLAYIIPWNGIYTAKKLSYLLKMGVHVKYAEKPFVNSGVSYPAGSLILLRKLNTHIEFDDLVSKNNYGISIYSTKKGMSDTGPDFGSDAVKNIKKIKIGILTGDKVSSLNVGEIWHFLEKDLKYPFSLIKEDYLSNNILNKIDVLVLPKGDIKNIDLIHEWVKNGGKLITFGKPNDLFELGLEEANIDTTEENSLIEFKNVDRKEISSTINGAIFKCDIDQSNSLMFGIDNPFYTLKLSSDLYKPIKNAFNAAVIPKKSSAKNGFVGKKVQNKTDNTVVASKLDYQNGEIVFFSDNPIFRGFWENGKLLFINSLFFE